MDRRSFLKALPTVAMLLAGCGGQSGGFSNGDNGTNGETDALPEAIRRLRSNFEDRGLEVIETSLENGWVVLTIQTRGSVNEDIRRAAGAFATVSVALERDLRVHVEDRGLRDASFEIRLDWATRFANDRLSDADYLDRIRQTRSES